MIYFPSTPQTPYLLGIQRCIPDTALLHRGANNEPLSGRVLAQVFRSQPRADKNRQGRMPGQQAYLIGISRLTGGRTGDDQSVRQKELATMSDIQQR